MINSLITIIDNWASYLNQFSSATQRNYLGTIRRFSRFCPPDFDQIEFSHIQSYLTDLAKHTDNKRSINTKIICLKSFFRYCSESFDIPNLGTKIRLFRTSQAESRVITDIEYNKLLKVSFGRDKDLIVFAANTGLRANELHSLTWENITQDSQYITFKGKGNKTRTVPLNGICQEILSKYRHKKHNGHIEFLHRYTLSCNYRVLCVRLAKKARIPSFGLHAFRHFFATRLLRNNVGIYKVAKLLGHSSVVTTERIYAHLVPADLFGLTDCLEN